MPYFVAGRGERAVGVCRHGFERRRPIRAYGIEIDARAASSPAGTQLLAEIPDLIGPGSTAEMTYYETPRGAKVFAAGTLNFAASIDEPPAAQLVENVWARLSRP